MAATGNLRKNLEAATDLDDHLANSVAAILPGAAARYLQEAPSPDFDRVFRCVEQIYPGFLYLAWRTHDGRHHCSIALDEQDLDRHSWLGVGASPALALTSALLASLGPGAHG